MKTAFLNEMLVMKSFARRERRRALKTEKAYKTISVGGAIGPPTNIKKGGTNSHTRTWIFKD